MGIRMCHQLHECERMLTSSSNGLLFFFPFFSSVSYFTSCSSRGRFSDTTLACATSTTAPMIPRLVRAARACSLLFTTFCTFGKTLGSRSEALSVGSRASGVYWR
jgi:hypothetical protein